MNIFTLLFTQPLANGLALFYKIVGNLGLAIILFSLALRFVLLPLTRPYMDSMKKMKKYQKEIDKLKKKHKNDRSKLMQAQADFYKEKGINPGAGCLPMILQFVILIALFRVFVQLLGADNGLTTQFNTLLYEPLKFGSDTIINKKFLYLDVTKPDVFNIAGLPFPVPGPILILAALTQFLSAKISTPYLEAEKKKAKKTKETADDMQVAMQSSFIYTLPLITLFIGINFPSGLALYWLVFSLFQLVQQYLTAGWGGLTPFAKGLGLLKSEEKND